MFSIADFDDFCLWMYVTIDDWYRQQADLPRRPGPLPFTCSDSELLTMTLVGECKGCTQETALMDFWRGRTDLFSAAGGGRTVPRWIERHQRRRRHPAGEGPWPRSYGGDHPRRLGHALPVEAVQSCFPEKQESALSRLAMSYSGFLMQWAISPITPQP